MNSLTSTLLTINRGILNVFDGKYEDAIKCFNSGVELFPNSITGNNNIAVCHM